MRGRLIYRGSTFCMIVCVSLFERVSFRLCIFVYASMGVGLSWIGLDVFWKFHLFCSNFYIRLSSFKYTWTDNIHDLQHMYGLYCIYNICYAMYNCFFHEKMQKICVIWEILLTFDIHITIVFPTDDFWTIIF